MQIDQSRHTFSALRSPGVKKHVSSFTKSLSVLLLKSTKSTMRKEPFRL